MKVSELKADMDTQFRNVRGEMDARFRNVDTTLQRIDARFEQIDARFERIDEWFEGVDRRLDGLDKRITDEAIVTRRRFDVVAEDLKSQLRAAAERSELHAQRVATISSENVTLLSALSDHELRLRVLEGTRGHQR